MSSPSTTLDLQGVVRYTLVSPNEIKAKWMSSRMVDRFSEPGVGHAERIVEQDSTYAESWPGVWEISYFEPDGKLAVTPFILKLERKEQVQLVPLLLRTMLSDLAVSRDVGASRISGQANTQWLWV